MVILFSFICISGSKDMDRMWGGIVRKGISEDRHLNQTQMITGNISVKIFWKLSSSKEEYNGLCLDTYLKLVPKRQKVIASVSWVSKRMKLDERRVIGRLCITQYLSGSGRNSYPEENGSRKYLHVYCWLKLKKEQTLNIDTTEFCWCHLKLWVTNISTTTIKTLPIAFRFILLG